MVHQFATLTSAKNESTNSKTVIQGAELYPLIVPFENLNKFYPNPGSANVSSCLSFSATTKKQKIRVIRVIRAKRTSSPGSYTLDKWNPYVYLHTQKEVHMRTNIVIDDKLMEEAMILSGAKTKKELISNALQEFVTTRKRLNLLDLDGKIEFEKTYNYKVLREGQ